MIPMGTLPMVRDTPKVVPLEDDIIYDNKRNSDTPRENSDKKQDTPQYQQWN
jgi:hypothetical protein